MSSFSFLKQSAISNHIDNRQSQSTIPIDNPNRQSQSTVRNQKIRSPKSPISNRLVPNQQSLGAHQFGVQHRGTRSTPNRVVTERNEFHILHRTLPHPADGYGHAAVALG